MDLAANDIRAAFAARLEQICADLGIVEGRGRQSALAKVFDISPNAARKWLRGDGLPELEMAIRIANLAGVNVTWLLQGIGPKRTDKTNTGREELLEGVAALPADDGQQVFDFIRYKFERSDGWFAREELARYMTMLDGIEKAGKK